MTPLTDEHQLKRAAGGEYDLELLTVEYTGGRSTHGVDEVLGWPGPSSINRGDAYAALVPAPVAPRIKQNGALDVSTDPADAARVFLDGNYLPAESGDSLWTYTTPGLVDSVALVGSTVYAGSRDGTVHAFQEA